MTKINTHIIDVCSSSNRHCDVRLLLHILFVHLIIFHLLRREIPVLNCAIEPSRGFIKLLGLLVSIISFFRLCFVDKLFTAIHAIRSIRHWNTGDLILFEGRWHNHRGITRRILAICYFFDWSYFHVFHPFIRWLFIPLYLWFFRWYCCGFVDL